MKILVDTPIWSLAFRRKKGSRDTRLSINLSEITELIREGRAAIIGPIRQEILSGISEDAQFEKLKEKLRAFEDLPITVDDYELAARFYNQCRRNGIQGSQVDFLICAVANRHDIPIFTMDNDFNFYSKHLDISLHSPRISIN